MSYVGAKNRIARKFRCNIFGRSRDPLIHKSNPPGVHGMRRKKKSDYGIQLEEKQKLKAVYGMLREKTLRNYFKKAVKKQGTSAENLIEFLESRLDVVVLRLKFAKTIFSARQLISHGKILVDGKKVDRASFQVKPGNTVSVKENARDLQPVVQGVNQVMRNVPEYLAVGSDSYTGNMLTPPKIDQIEFPLNINVSVVCDLLQRYV